MMLSASPTSLMRSSLEEMLESLRQRDEAMEKAKDLPPALPARPTSRARLPSARQSLPTSFKVGDNGQIESKMETGLAKGKNDTKRKEKELGSKMGSFRSKKMRKDQSSLDSNPYMEQSGTQSKETISSSLEWDDNIGYFINKRLSVWCQLPNGKWVSGKIQSTSGDKIIVLVSSGEVVKVSMAELLPANPDILQGVDDLIQLSYLNEPSVLHNLKYRYSRDVIYSKAGPILVALNPFKDVPLYGNEIITAYQHKVMDGPHVYSTANTAYKEMMREKKDQSIIISGESGAGKTETAKHVMCYLTALGGDSGGVECEILQTNCILEAFGNAKTSRNNNSSRVGKLIDIHFSPSGKILGAKIQTYLLEKSRVVQLTNGDRSYNIFYQLCAGAPSALRERLNVKMASEYYYLTQSDCLEIDGVDDAQMFYKLMDAMDAIHICTEDQEQAFVMLAAILWLGNISFQVIDLESHVEVSNDEAVNNAARLLSCTAHDLMLTLSTHKIQAGKDTIAKSLTLKQAMDRRDALSKFIYSSLFDWLVDQINKSLAEDEEKTRMSISILDIYGFETFKKNSFEQFCINYANERLQQHFNRHLFKLEQEECEEDGIDWTKVNFEDNQECLNLLEKRPLGLLSLLDEESNLPKGTDLTFANKLKLHLSGNSCFKGERGRAFGVRHYAGEVVYDTNGFLEKNRDPLHSDFFHLLSSSTSSLLQLFASKIPAQSPKVSQSAGLESGMQGVGTKFKGQLFKLMHRLENTTPRFIRCIKPNTKKLPGIYEEDLVSHQLQCCGILEVVRISRYGYPTRMTHQEFSERYGSLLEGPDVSQDPLSMSVAIVKQFNILPEMYRVGYTKVYLRMGQIAKLEEQRKILEGIIGVQKNFRGYKARCYFQEMREGVTILQSFIRGENARRKCCFTEKKWSCYGPLSVDEQLMAAIHLQSAIRGWLSRREFSGKLTLKEHFLQASKEDGISKRKQAKKMSEAKVTPQEQDEAQSSILVELNRRVVRAEATVLKKDEENAALREQLQQFERRWSDYEMKMKTMEETWQMQMSSLQASLAAARKSLAADNTAGQPGRPDSIMSPRFYDYGDNASGCQTPSGIAPSTFFNPFHDYRAGREHNGPANAVGSLAKEFENQRQNFDNDAKALVEVTGGQSASNVNADEELRRLKHRFQIWKKDYKARLRETKVRVQKFCHGDEKGRRKWWGKISALGS